MANTKSITSDDQAKPTPHGGWAAQPGLTPRDFFLTTIRDDATALQAIVTTLESSAGALKRRATRDEVFRLLARVCADCEGLKIAIQRGLR